MSLSPNEKYPGATEADPNYKDSKFKDNNPSTTNNGSPLKALDRNEQLALQEAMMNAAGFDYNGVVDTPQNSQMFNAYKAALSNGANLLSNHNFIIASPDDSQPAPSATPTSYPPGYQIFSGVFANETTGILNLTYIDGRVSFSGGDFYMAVPNTGALENITEFVASVADFDGKPRTRGVSFALVGDEYRVTVGVDALEDTGGNATPLGSVKFEQGSVATGHAAVGNAQEKSHIGDSQIKGGNIYPVDSTLSAKSGDDLTGVNFVRLAGGDFQSVTLFPVIKKDGTKTSLSGSISNINLTTKPYSATIGVDEVWLLDINHWHTPTLGVSFRAFWATPNEDSTVAFSTLIGLDYVPVVDMEGGGFIVSETLNITRQLKFFGAPGSYIDYKGLTGSCIDIGDDISNFTDIRLEGVEIFDNGRDRQNTYTIRLRKTNRSSLSKVRISVGDEYSAIYGSLTEQQQLDLRFGIHITSNSFTNFISECFLSKSGILVESSDNHIIDSVLWANERRTTIELRAASTMIDGNQIIPGVDYGIYSPSADITHTQILNNYFDGNTSLQSVIPTGHCIYLDGNLRRSVIASNRFFIPAKRSIHIAGALEASSISGGNVFSNGDSADLGFGDIYIGMSNGSNIVGNAFFRDNFAQKTGSGRTQPNQPPITIAEIGSEFDEPTLISSNSVQGVNSYSNSVYPLVSGVLTKHNHRTINNNNTFESRYSDNQQLFSEKLTLDNAQLDSLPRGSVYTDDLNALGITLPADTTGWITTERLQDAADLSELPFAKQEILTQGNQLIFVRTLNNGAWSAWRQI